jgi:hypothetical protein
MTIKSTALASVVFALISSTASADFVTETFTGTVTGFDTLGVFGTAGASLDTTYTAVYLFNTSLGRNLSSTGLFEITGGTPAGAPSPSLGATLTINGKTFSVDGQFSADLQTRNNTNSNHANVQFEAEAIARQSSFVFFQTTLL